MGNFDNLLLIYYEQQPVYQQLSRGRAYVAKRSHSQEGGGEVGSGCKIPMYIEQNHQKGKFRKRLCTTYQYNCLVLDYSLTNWCTFADVTTYIHLTILKLEIWQKNSNEVWNNLIQSGLVPCGFDAFASAFSDVSDSIPRRSVWSLLARLILIFLCDDGHQGDLYSFNGRWPCNWPT